MSQQINLFNPIFLQQKKMFSARTMAQALGVLTLGAVLIAGFALGLPVFKKTGNGSSNHGLAFTEAVEAFERNLLNDALQRSGGNLTQASQELGMAKTTLFDKVKKYGLSH